MSAEIHVNDEPILRATVKDQDGAVVNVSAASVKQIILKKPGAASAAKTATFTTDGSDGKIEYQVTTAELDTVGEWERQAYVVLATRPYRSDISRFPVKANL